MQIISHLIEFASQYPSEVFSIVATVWGSLQFIPSRYKRPVTEAGNILWTKYKEYRSLKQELSDLREKVKELEEQNKQLKMQNGEQNKNEDNSTN